VLLLVALVKMSRFTEVFSSGVPNSSSTGTTFLTARPLMGRCKERLVDGISSSTVSGSGRRRLDQTEVHFVNRYQAAFNAVPLKGKVGLSCSSSDSGWI